MTPRLWTCRVCLHEFDAREQEPACPDAAVCPDCHQDSSECPWCGPHLVFVIPRRLYHKEIPNTKHPVELLCGAEYALINSTNNKEVVSCEECIRLMKGQRTNNATDV